MDDDLYQKNSSLMPGDIADLRNNPIRSIEHTSHETGRFNTMTGSGGASSKENTTKSKENTTKKGAGKSEAPKPDYQKEYLRKQREQAKAAKVIPLQDDAKRALEDRLQNEKETEYRVRARDLSTQIRWWESQRGLGQYSDQEVEGNKAMLQQQLGAIDPRYWNG